MVLKKRLNFGFSGYQIPVIPKAPRTARKRRPCKKLNDDQICAFELLAAVAGKLLLENESSSSSNAGAPAGKDEFADCRDTIECEQTEDDKALNQGSCVEIAYIPEAADQEQNFKNNSSKPYHTEHKSFLEHASTVIGSNSLTKDWSEVKNESCKAVNEDAKLQIKVEGGSPNPDDPSDIRIVEVTLKQLDDDSKQTELTVANACSVKAPIEKNVNNSALINSDSSVQLPLYGHPVPCASFVKSRNNVKLGVRDDDENYFGCYRRSTKIRTFKPTSHIEYRRTRKMLTSTHWKVAPKLKDCKSSYSNDGMMSFSRKRKNMHGNERCWLEILFKRMKFCDHSFAVAYDLEASSESISNKPKKGIKGDIITSPAVLTKGAVVSASVRNHQKKDPNVQFSIKSFKVPELYIEVPETEPVGSLKKTVMEAVTAILGSGLRVGMVLRGKKVRDDNRTLQQAGISQNDNLDTLGFTLEPSFTRAPLSLSPKDDTPASASYITDKKLSRRPPSPILELLPPNALSDPPKTKLDKHDESSHELEMLPTNPFDQSADEAVPDSKALAVVPPVNAESLAVVPVYHRNRHSELSQRRTRRPFSVAEVEAVVEAVEQLGTGRWCDVKMRAFDNAHHRTYVDLKKKEQDIANATILVEVAKQRLQGLRVDGWDPLIDKVSTFCIKYDILIPNFDELYANSGRSRRKAVDHVVLHHFRVEVFYKIIDWQLQELNDRLNEVTSDLFHGVACLNKVNSFSSFDIKKIVKMVELYPDDFDQFNMGFLENQLANYIIDVRDIDERFSNLGGLGELSRKLVETKKNTTYPLVFLLVKLALLLPVATATVERAFSAMKYIKNDLWNRIDDEFFDGCIVPYVEKKVFRTISNESIIKTFQEMKHRRIQL